ncbi:MAG: PspA/IM30 family protein [Candidatus Poribacteria bacterium]|nr:PspA/IM30 family protein [Candidatus Poribacteria bacterium]
MGVFSRISTIFKSNVNAALTKAEDPEKILNQVIIEMNEQLAEAKQRVASAIADEKRLQRQYQETVEQAKQWEGKATSAVQKERDDLAREALARRNEHQRLADEYKIQWEKQRQAVDQLKEHLRGLERKIEEASRKKNLLITRQKRAKAQKQIHETMAGMKDSSAFEAFDRMEQKVGDIEAAADAAAEMADFEADTLEDEFAKLETKENVDDDLAALKATLGQGAASDEVQSDA